MYTYFSRFLHHTLSCPDAKPQSTSILSPSGLTRWSRSNQVANLPHLYTPIKSECDSLCAGRSMVEMLGVLAIIGVLSVGAIAGYSKAMMKYKLNKHAESFNMLLNNALQLEGKLSFTPNDVTFYGDMFRKLNLIPEGFKYVSNQYLADIFGNYLWIYHHDNLNGDSGLHFSAIGYNFQPSSQGIELCRNIVITAKENSANLSRINTDKMHSDGSVTENIGTIYGDKYCNNSDEPCLYNLTLDKIANLCNICNESACTIYIVWE